MASDKKAKLTLSDIDEIRSAVARYFGGIMGLNAQDRSDDNGAMNEVMDILIQLRSEAKQEKNYALSDAIRNRLKDKGIELMDSKEGTTWKIN